MFRCIRVGEVGNNMYVSITTKNAALIQRAWNVLKQDGEIYMELTESFFTVLLGSLRDRFGIDWMFTAIKSECVFTHPNSKRQYTLYQRHYSNSCMDNS